MKIVPFDPNWVAWGASNGTLLGTYSGGSNTAFGGDVTGDPGDLSVIGMRRTVSLSSNMGDNTVGTVLTTIQSSPWLATFAVSSNSGVSYGSNSTNVAEIALVGAATTVARSDHYHGGVNAITSSSSNTLQRGVVNLRSGANIGLTATDTDGDGEFDTVTISATATSSSSASEVGYAPYAFPLGFGLSANDTFTTASNLAAAGGAIYSPIVVTTTMLLQACKFRSTDTGTARSWEWRLYQDTGSTTLPEVAGANGSESFTPSAASTRTAAATGAPVTLTPGVYWVVLRNTHATNTLGVAYSGTLPVSNPIQASGQVVTSTISALGSTFDASVATTSFPRLFGIVLTGRAFGEGSSRW